jgi:hypothetical protein
MQWARMCWSMMGMIGHASDGPLGARVGMKDIEEMDPLRACLISSAGTITHVKMIETCVESVLPPYPSNSQQRVVSFGLVMMFRSCVYIIKLPNSIRKMES